MSYSVTSCVLQHHFLCPTALLPVSYSIAFCVLQCYFPCPTASLSVSYSVTSCVLQRFFLCPTALLPVSYRLHCLTPEKSAASACFDGDGILNAPKAKSISADWEGEGGGVPSLSHIQKLNRIPSPPSPVVFRAPPPSYCEMICVFQWIRGSHHMRRQQSALPGDSISSSLVCLSVHPSIS